jgi:predicted TIM-barrel fold metal-dependent hydrolase
VRNLIVADSARDQVVGGAYGPYLASAERCALPVFIYAPNYLREVGDLVQTHPGVRFVLDHFGVRAGLPGSFAHRGYRQGARRWALENLSAVLDLAKYPNVSVKLTGGPSLSEQPYPFDDLWPILISFMERFGPERLMWGTDWTRVDNATYSEGVRYVIESDQLSNDEKAAVMGRSLRAVLGWR